MENLVYLGAMITNNCDYSKEIRGKYLPKCDGLSDKHTDGQGGNTSINEERAVAITSVLQRNMRLRMLRSKHSIRRGLRLSIAKGEKKAMTGYQKISGAMRAWSSFSFIGHFLRSYLLEKDLHEISLRKMNE